MDADVSWAKIQSIYTDGYPSCVSSLSCESISLVDVAVQFELSRISNHSLFVSNPAESRLVDITLCQHGVWGVTRCRRERGVMPSPGRVRYRQSKQRPAHDVEYIMSIVLES